MIRTRTALFLAGLVTLLGQVVLLREQLVASFGVELAAVLALGVLLLGGASGALIGRRMGGATPQKACALFLTLAALLPSSLAFLRGQTTLLGATPGAYLPLAHQLGGTLLVFFPAGFISGILFQCLATMAGLSGRSLAWAYATESAGSVVGGLLATLASAAGASDMATCLGASALAACAPGLAGLARGRRSMSVFGSVLAALLACGVAVAVPLDLATTRWSQPDAQEVKDTPYARLTLTQRLGQVAIFQDRSLLFETEGTSAEEFVHPAALQVEAPRRVLLLGGGGEGTLAEVLKHGPQEAVLVEMDRDFHGVLLGHLPAESRGAFSDPRARVVFGDPRAFLRGSKGWDLILVGSCEPSTGQANRFFTKEFFCLAAARLNRGGVLALRLRSAENLWTPLLAMRNAAVFKAMRGAFPDALVLPGTTDLLIGARGTVIRDPETLAVRLRERRIRARLVCEPYLRYLYTDSRVEEAASMVARAPAAENSDARPICHAVTAALWLSRFVPGFAVRDFRVGAGWGGVGAGGGAVALLLALALRRSEGPRRAGLAFVAGFVGMVLESVLILAYQSWEGALYRDIGLLVTLFMVGLSLGAAGMGGCGNIRASRVGPAAAGAGFLLCLGVSAALATGPHPGWVLAALLMGGGGVTGTLFACAGSGPEGLRGAGTLYAADLAGAGIGTTAGGILAVPILGMAPTCLGLAACMVIAAPLAWGRASRVPQS